MYLLSLFYRRESWIPEKVRHLPKVAELVSGAVGIPTQEIWLQHLALKHFNNKAHNLLFSAQIVKASKIYKWDREYLQNRENFMEGEIWSEITLKGEVSWFKQWNRDSEFIMKNEEISGQNSRKSESSRSLMASNEISLFLKATG